jgi:hypothetical protein
LGRSPRESQEQDLGRFGFAGFDQMDGSGHKKLGLAGAGTCDYELRSIAIGYRLWPTIRVDLDLLQGHASPQKGQPKIGALTGARYHRGGTEGRASEAR